MPPATPLQLSLDGSPAALESARRQLLEHLGPIGRSAENRRAVYAMELVLEEWVSNAFRHGGSRQVTLSAALEQAQLTLQFVDDGVAFDPRVRPEPALPSDLDHAQPGGLGLLLIQRYASACEYRREAGRNVLRVSIALVTAPSA